MREIKSRHVGLFIESNEVDGEQKPIVILYVDQIMMRRECSGIEHAERVFSELADVFDLWGGEERPKWIPQRPVDASDHTVSDSTQHRE